MTPPKKTQRTTSKTSKKEPKAAQGASQEVVPAPSVPEVVDTQVDLAGVSPGLRPDPPKPRTVNLKCRNMSCPSIEAYVMMDEGRIRRYYCVKCNYVMGVDVGSAVHF